MIKEIKYNGFTETPSDYECPDGDLATVTGLVPEDEALHPVQPARNLFQLPADFTVCFVHANASGYKHYILRHDYTTEEGTAPDVVTHKHSDFYWLNMPEDFINYADTDTSSAGYLAWQAIIANNLIIQFTDKDIYEVNAVGNTLLFLTSDGMYYCLWKGDTEGYKNLGNHLPEAHLSFGLQGKVDGSAQGNVECDDNIADHITWDGGIAYFDDRIKNQISGSVLALVNSYIADRQNKQGHFIFPFLVRYAYRLYDTTLVMHSSPVLMITTTKDGGVGVRFNIADDYLYFAVRALLFDLDYQLLQNIPGIENWKDIIESVDIFISAPIYTYDYSGKEVIGFKNYNNITGFTISKITDDSDTRVPDTINYCKWTENQTRKPTGQAVNDMDELVIPYHDAEYINGAIKGCQNFYLLKSIPIDELSTSRTIIDISENYLDTLVNRERMTDDSESHDKLSPTYSFVYNSRLNISNIKKALMTPFPMCESFCYDNRSYTPVLSQDLGASSYIIYVIIEEGGKKYVMRSNLTSTMGYYGGTGEYLPFYYFYYPNPNAKMVVIDESYFDSTSQQIVVKRYKLPLKKHDFLNGAVYFNGFVNLEAYTETIVVTTNNIVNIPNKVYTSEVNNPFVFLPTGIRTIGISEIVGIRPAVKTMSPAQYGQFKFYVFTLEGVWALEVSKEGYLQEPTLVTPDVVMGAKDNEVRSITQIDGAVLFASERGIMMLEGSTCTCISDTLNSHDPFIPFATLPANDVLPGLRSVCVDFISTIAPVPFSTFIKDCSMLYDYPHQRIILYSASQPYAYTFSLKSKQWGMIPSTIQSTVLDYPNAMAMIKVVETVEENNVTVQHEYPVFADFSHDPDPVTPATALAPVQGLIITRPLKLDMPDVLKTVESIIQRGNFEKGHVQCVLYGSRDLQNWLLVKSSVDHYLRGFSGTPYKYFRIALLCQLDDNESIFGCSIQFNPRYQNKLR